MPTDQGIIVSGSFAGCSFVCLQQVLGRTSIATRGSVRLFYAQQPDAEKSNKGTGENEMDNVITLNSDEMDKVDRLLQYAKEWAEKHQVAIGVAEVALGAAAISFGVNTGAIEIGTDIVMTLTNNVARQVGIGSAIAGGYLGSLIGAIGVAAMGTAIGVPAALVVGGAAWVFGTSGYTIGQEIFNFLHPIDFGKFIGGSSLLVVGLALVLDGIRRLLPQRIKDEIKAVSSAFVRGVASGTIFLAECVTKVIATSLDGLLDIYNKAYKKLQELLKTPEANTIAATTTIIGGAVGGGVVGTSVAASTVTVLGSQTLGAAALGLGLVSAPIWPVIVIGTGGAIVGVGVWYAIKKFLKLDDDVDLLVDDLSVGYC